MGFAAGCTNSSFHPANWYMKECKMFSYGFNGCKSLREFDFSKFDTSNVE